MRALARYGSTLSPLLYRSDSVADWFALVDDLPAALSGRPLLARLAPKLIPPVTVAVAQGGGKLSLITPAQAHDELTARRDLYLAGRLSKKLEIIYGDFDPLVEAAISTVVEVSALDWPRRISLDDAILRCLGISYRAEVRPEPPEKIRRMFDAFADFYRCRFAPRIEAKARARGIILHNEIFSDPRDENIRSREQLELQVILTRSRRRSMLRWPQQLLVFDGSLPYVLGKLRRSWL